MSPPGNKVAREREAEAVPASVTGVGPDRAKAKGTAPKTGPAPGNAPGMGRAMGRDRAVVPENRTVRVVKGNEADSVTSNRSIPLPGSHALPGKLQQAHGDRACCHNVDLSKRANRMRRVFFKGVHEIISFSLQLEHSINRSCLPSPHRRSMSVMPFNVSWCGKSPGNCKKSPAAKKYLSLVSNFQLFDFHI